MAQPNLDEKFDAMHLDTTTNNTTANTTKENSIKDSKKHVDEQSSLMEKLCQLNKRVLEQENIVDHHECLLHELEEEQVATARALTAIEHKLAGFQSIAANDIPNLAASQPDGGPLRFWCLRTKRIVLGKGRIFVDQQYAWATAVDGFYYPFIELSNIAHDSPQK